jgi:glycosyltransferase involved in cell wall biosynthesis
MSNLLALWMIVKNEAGSIAQTILSCIPEIDCVVLIDTGSTDDTVEQARRACDDQGIPLHLYHEHFVDFATTRNRGLELAAPHAEWLLMLNGDETVHGIESIGEACRLRRHPATMGERGAMNVEVVYGGINFRYPRLTRANSGWIYRGKTHEALVHPDGISPSVVVPSAQILRGPEDLERKRSQWKRDEHILMDVLHEDPNDARSQFYLAQTCECLGYWDAATRWYKARSENQKGWAPETYETFLRLAKLTTVNADVMFFLTRAIELRPSWPDAYVLLAEHCYTYRNWITCYLYARRACELSFSKETLFSQTRLELLRWDLLGASAYYAGDMELGRKALLRAMALAPDDDRIQSNMRFYA